MEGVTLKYLLVVRVFAFNALYVPPDVELEVTAAVLPIDPLDTVYLYCNATPSGSLAVTSIETAVPSVANV